MMLSLLRLPLKILKSLACSALKVFIFLALCALILNFIGDKNVHGFQKGPGTERNHTARC